MYCWVVGDRWEQLTSLTRNLANDFIQSDLQVPRTHTRNNMVYTKLTCGLGKLGIEPP